MIDKQDFILYGPIFPKYKFLHNHVKIYAAVAAVRPNFLKASANFFSNYTSDY